jgi:hypothetical protein
MRDNSENKRRRKLRQRRETNKGGKKNLGIKRIQINKEGGN